ncbi:MAG: PEGA domain-containing protein [Deltaproteobacteria bacterium]|nr:PEGA domain-containing protein [Deltaproteobacteria bacterium]
MRTLDNNCAVVLALWDEEVSGRRLSPAETELIKAHLTRCSECRLEAKTLSNIAFDCTAGPAPDLDELAERRWVDEVVSRAEIATKPSESSRRRAAGWLVVAASVLIATSALVYWKLNTVAPSKKGESPVPQSVLHIQGQVLLASRDVQKGGATVSAGDTLKVGERVAVGRGRAVLEIVSGITLLLEPSTEIEIKKPGSKGIEVALNKGLVIAHVDPRRQGPDFSVSTPDGLVCVTGTVFSVAAHEDESKVRVYRGSVRLEEHSGTQHKVRVGESAIFDKDSVARLSKDEVEVASNVLKVFELLSSTQFAALEIESVPADAMVTIDDVAFGHTPLTAFVRVGHRKLVMTKDGHESVRELLELRPDSELTRVFDLGETPAEEDVVEPKRDDLAKATPKKRRAQHSTSREQPTSAELLAKAQAMRAGRNWSGAVEAYEDLIRQYPAGAESGPSLVSLGKIQLDHQRKPAAALNAFNAYLRRTRRGTLAQEAAFGRATALRALGKRDQEKTALEMFLREFPSAIQNKRVKERLAELK